MKKQVTRQIKILTEHPVFIVFIVALLARIALAAVVAIWFDSVLFLDDGGYIDLATSHARGGPMDYYFWNINLSFLAPIGFLFRIFGPVPFLAQCMSAIAGATAAVCVTKLLLRHTGPTPALAAGLLISLYPSQILWSSLVLKDALVWMALAVLAVLTAWWHKQTAWKGIGLGIVGHAAVLVYISHLRVHTLMVACIALTMVAVWKSATYRALRVGTLFLLLLIVPLQAGSGPAGQEVTQVGIFGMEEQRQAGAANASTAVVDLPLNDQLTQVHQDFDKVSDDLAKFSGIASGDDPPSPEEAAAILARSTATLVLAQEQLAELETDALDYETFEKPLQVRLRNIISEISETPTQLSRLIQYGPSTMSRSSIIDVIDDVQTIRDQLPNIQSNLDDLESSTLTDDILYLPNGIRVMLIDPLPHHLTRSSNLSIAFLEHLLWYPALILASIGIYVNRNTLFRRRTGSPELLFAFLLLCGLTAMWGLVEGNFGTAFRHRGEFVWAVILLAGLGFAHVRHPKRIDVTNPPLLDHSNDD